MSLENKCRLEGLVAARADLGVGGDVSADCGGILTRSVDQTQGDHRRKCFQMTLCSNCPLRKRGIEDIAGMVANATAPITDKPELEH